MGVDITQAIPAHTEAALLEYINARTAELWERYAWPEWTRIEQREYRATYAGGTAYVTGDEVFYDGAYYRALSSTTGNLPTNAVYWEAATDMLKNIALEQAGETAIGEVIDVWSADRRVATGAVRYGFEIMEDGLLVASGPAQPWVEFTLRPSVFTTSDLDANTYPRALAESVKLLAAADAQREDGQFEKAGVLEGLGYAKLDAELDKLEMKQGQQRRFCVGG
jgi:hypothetical protein